VFDLLGDSNAMARSDGLELPTFRFEDKSVANAGVCVICIGRWGMGWCRWWYCLVLLGLCVL
jgi:hypothetical protein